MRILCKRRLISGAVWDKILKGMETQNTRFQSNKQMLLYFLRDSRHFFAISMVSACLLALSDKTDEKILDECEATHSLLKNAYSDSTFPQFCAYILCMTDGIPEDKATRLMELFFALRASKKKYLTGHEMGVLAALSLTDISTGELMDTVIDIEAFLSKQKDYGFLSGFDEKRRLMNAAMLATAAYGDRSLTAMNIMAAIVALAAENEEDDAATVAIIAANT